MMIGASETGTPPAGYLTALPTPLLEGVIDEEAFVSFVKWQIEQGIAGIVVCGTTGEAASLSEAEQRRLIRLAVDTAAGRVPVIAGAGSCATERAIVLARAAEAAGADALLSVAPYYNRPPQERLFRHFAAIHDATGVPLLLYDVPARTGCALADDTICRLAELPRVAGLKDATGETGRAARLRRRLGADFTLYSGDDLSVHDFLRHGGNGCISVTWNVAPKLCLELFASHHRAQTDRATVIAAALRPLTLALFVESNPIALKCALRLTGHMRDEVRLPLVPASDATRGVVRRALAALGLRTAADHMFERHLPIASWHRGGARTRRTAA